METGDSIRRWFEQTGLDLQEVRRADYGGSKDANFTSCKHTAKQDKQPVYWHNPINQSASI